MADRLDRQQGQGTGRSRRRRVGRSGGTADRDPLADPQQQARTICLRLLAVRPRTRAELATALDRRGIPEQDATAVLERYSEVGVIDDETFAKAWVTSRHEGRGLARGALARELRQRGVDSSTISTALTEVDGETEVATARALVERRLRSMSGVAPEVALRRLVSMLARKGYPAGLAVRVVRDALSDAPDTAGFAAELDVDVVAGGLGSDEASMPGGPSDG